MENLEPNGSRMQTADIRLLKNINERLVLNLIREHRLISGAQLAKSTGLRASTIAKVLRSLKSKSLILYQGKGESTQKGGKRPFLWSLNSQIGYVVGIDLGIKRAIGVLLDLDGNMVHHQEYTGRPVERPEDLTELAVYIVDDLISSLELDKSDILGLGVGITGIVNSVQGVVLTTGMLRQTGIPLRDMLRAHLAYPVFLENNANAAAMGEKWLGRGKGVENFMIAVVDVDRGVGGFGIGLMLRNELFMGTDFAAGELNVTLPTLDSELRVQRGWLAESQVLRNSVGSVEDLRIHHMIKAAQQNEQFALVYFRRLGHQIGRRIAASVGLINPEKLIIEGEIAELGDTITKPIKEAIELEVHPISSASLQVETGIHRQYTVSIGAAAVVLNDIFRMPEVGADASVAYFG